MVFSAAVTLLSNWPTADCRLVSSPRATAGLPAIDSQLRHLHLDGAQGVHQRGGLHVDLRLQVWV